jgi:hypothetical protein
MKADLTQLTTVHNCIQELLKYTELYEYTELVMNYIPSIYLLVDIIFIKE